MGERMLRTRSRCSVRFSHIERTRGVLLGLKAFRFDAGEECVWEGGRFPTAKQKNPAYDVDAFFLGFSFDFWAQKHNFGLKYPFFVIFVKKKTSKFLHWCLKWERTQGFWG